MAVVYPERCFSSDQYLLKTVIDSMNPTMVFDRSTTMINSLPKLISIIAGLVTQLGDAWFVLLGIFTMYWWGLRDPSLADSLRKGCLYLFALTISSYSLTVILKYVFTLPRPSGAAAAIPPVWLPAVIDPVYEWMVTSEGYGFPSGHALKATVVYGCASLLFTKWDSHHQYSIAAVVVGMVATSRIVLGVHYLIDVVGGILIGLVFLGGMNRITKENPGRALAITVLLSLFAVVLSTEYKSGLALVSAVIALGIWELSIDENDYIPG